MSNCFVFVQRSPKTMTGLFSSGILRISTLAMKRVTQREGFSVDCSLFPSNLPVCNFIVFFFFLQRFRGQMVVTVKDASPHEMSKA